MSVKLRQSSQSKYVRHFCSPARIGDACEQGTHICRRQRGDAEVARRRKHLANHSAQHTCLRRASTPAQRTSPSSEERSMTDRNTSAAGKQIVGGGVRSRRGGGRKARYAAIPML